MLQQGQRPALASRGVRLGAAVLRLCRGGRDGGLCARGGVARPDSHDALVSRAFKDGRPDDMDTPKPIHSVTQNAGASNVAPLRCALRRRSTPAPRHSSGAGRAQAPRSVSALGVVVRGDRHEWSRAVITRRPESTMRRAWLELDQNVSRYGPVKSTRSRRASRSRQTIRWRCPSTRRH